METSVEDDVLRKNWGYLLIGVIIAFVCLAGKLWYVQIIKGGKYTEQAENNRIRKVRLAAPRGTIYDRDMKTLVDNKPSFDVYFHPLTIKGKTSEESRKLRLKYLEKISRLLKVDFSLLKKRFNQGGGYSTIKVKTDIDWEDVAKIETMSMTYGLGPPLTINDETKRVYPYKELMCHFLGRISEISPEKLVEPDYTDYRPGDFAGRTGIEESYESFLKGQFGSETIVENARNVVLDTLDRTEPVAGKSLVMAVDIDLVVSAAKAMRALGNKSGAVIALDVRTGEVLCALSLPGYNPEIFSRVLTKEKWDKLLNDPKKPLTNKAISNAYPPGSTWKIVTALAGLHSEVIKKGWRATCLGKWKYGDRVFRCWSKQGHGTVGIHKAIVRSCDVFFYKASLKIGVDRIARWANDLGAGGKTGIDISLEVKGTVPTKEWKLKKLGSEWIAGETLSCAIGQGYNLVTTLQMAVIYATVANGGVVYKPRLVNKILNPDGKVIKEFGPEVIRTVDIDKKILKILNRGFTGVVNSPSGTGHRAKLKNVLVAGKTGTAQVRKIKARRIHISNMKWEHRDHAWFAAYAPADDPEIAVVVLAEHSGHGGTAAAPVAREVLATYFEKRRRARAAPLPEEEQSATNEN